MFRFILLCISALQLPSAIAQAAPEPVAVINGRPIPAGRVQLEFYLARAPEGAPPEARRQLLEKLIDRELIRQFLESRKVSADPQKLAEQETLVRKVIVQRGGRLNDVLQRLHLDEQSFRDVLSLPLAWDAYVRGAVTEQQIRRDWDAHQPELDGTRLRAAQIVRILPADASAADWEAAESLLRGLRERILAGKPSFAEAAREFSQSPSGQKGGDLGEFGYQGRVDEAISKAAFELKPGEISAPFRSRSGVHIVQLQERIPGQLSLEDARPEILERLSRKLWDEQVRQLREHASVQILEPDAK
jgi:parvulin-like peptidyl-prolyl isomerase